MNRFNFAIEYKTLFGEHKIAVFFEPVTVISSKRCIKIISRNKTINIRSKDAIACTIFDEEANKRKLGNLIAASAGNRVDCFINESNVMQSVLSDEPKEKTEEQTITSPIPST